MSQLFYALTQHPEILKRAQAEIDNIVGPDRLPISSDRPKLPYIDALFCETLRYAAPVPMGLPHRLTEDDSHNGMFIPKGSFVCTILTLPSASNSMNMNTVRYSPTSGQCRETQSVTRTPMSFDQNDSSISPMSRHAILILAAMFMALVGADAQAFTSSRRRCGI